MAFRCKLEERVAAAIDKSWRYEPRGYNYTIFRKYTPDFVKHIRNAGSIEEIWIEVKGYFRPGDTAKYKAIRAYYPDHRLIMCFSHPHKPVRKGAKLTMAQWAEKEGWGWTTPQEIEEEGI